MLALAGAALSAWALGFPSIGIDDANIIFVYARNLSAGEGFVWTPGHERVEGSTTLLWTLVCATGYALTPTPERLLAGVCTALVAFALWVALDLARRLGGRAGALLAFGWLLVVPGFYAWTTTTLMETALWTAALHALAGSGAALTLGALEVRRAATAIAAAAIAAAATRPEALALAPAALGLIAFANAGRERAALRGLAAAFAALVAGIAVLTAYRLLYFGVPLPNTYYAKVSPDRLYALRAGARYLREYLAAEPLAAAFALLALVLFAHTGWRQIGALRGGAPPDARARASFVVAGIALAGLALPLATGGDHFGSFRLYQPFVPLLALPAAFALSRVLAERARLGRAAAIAIALLLAWQGHAAWRHFEDESGLAHEYDIARAGRIVGEELNAMFPASSRPRIASTMVGGIGLAYAGRTLDLLGLNWAEMGRAPGDRKGPFGHAAFQPEVFWLDPPDIFLPRVRRRVPQHACELLGEFYSRVLGDLQRDERFRAAYLPGYAMTPRGPLAAFFLREWIRAGQPVVLHAFVGDEAVCEVDWSRHPMRLEYLRRQGLPLPPPRASVPPGRASGL